MVNIMSRWSYGGEGCGVKYVDFEEDGPRTVIGCMWDTDVDILRRTLRSYLAGVGFDGEFLMGRHNMTRLLTVGVSVDFLSVSPEFVET